MSDKKTAIITGASGSIGTGLVEGFLKQGFNVVGTSLNSGPSLTESPSLVLVDGDIGKQETAARVVEAAIKHFGTADILVNNAGIFRKKPFTDSARDVETRIRKCRNHFGIARGSADRGHKWLGLADSATVTRATDS